jgi:glycosyltransferase involved in cell wall biosynthesis
VIANTRRRRFDVVEITNEMPVNRIGGVGTVVENLLSGFEEIGVRALWFLADHPYRPSDVDEILAAYPDVAVGTYDELDRFAAPLAHLHAYAFGPGLVQALDRRPTVFTLHSLLLEEERSNDVDLAGSVRSQEALIAASQEVVLVSEAERSRYGKLGYLRLNERHSVVHNGVRPATRFRSPRGRRTLGFSGRLVPRKRPEYLPMLLREPDFADCTVLVAGKAFSIYARNLVRQLGVEERVRYLGWCGGERLEAFYEAIDVLAVPSAYEPFCMAALEAVARRVPVVCTAVDGLVELLGDHAFYCADPSYESFRDAMRRWRVSTDEELSALAAAARARHEALYTDVTMARAYADRFDALSCRRGTSA